MLAVLKDDSLGFNPTSMSLRLYKDDIPADRCCSSDKLARSHAPPPPLPLITAGRALR